MRAKTLLACGLALVFALAGYPLSAQNATLVGTVTDADTRMPLNAALVRVLGLSDDLAGGESTNEQGGFRFSLPSGTYSIVIDHIGYQSHRVDAVRVRAGETKTIEVALVSRALELNPVIVTASRREEKALDAPASIATVSQEIIRERIASTPIQHLKGLPGVDVVETGLQQSNVVTRGFNNVFSGALLVLTDNRYAFVPSLRVNAHNFVPITSLDLERIEVVLGPGAALYGPNAASGVLHMISSSPIDAPGTTFSIAGGERSIFQGVGRWAHRASDRLGFKVSGQYFKGNDWRFSDPSEVSARAAAATAAGAAQITAAGGDPTLVGNRLVESERWSVEARLDYRFDSDSELILSGGTNTSLSSIEMTGIGAGQASDWRSSYLQARLRSGRLFAQAFLNASDAGDTYLLRTGQPIVDESRLFAGRFSTAWTSVIARTSSSESTFSAPTRAPREPSTAVTRMTTMSPRLEVTCIQPRRWRPR
jgi:iron complex outermembrane receptor protein